MAVTIPAKTFAGNLLVGRTLNASFAIPAKTLAGELLTGEVINASFSIPSRQVPSVFSMTASGGGIGGGVATVVTRLGGMAHTASGGGIGGGVATVVTRLGGMAHTASGGALGSGTAGATSGGNLFVVGSGGALGSGVAAVAKKLVWTASGGATGSGEAAASKASDLPVVGIRISSWLSSGGTAALRTEGIRISGFLKSGVSTAAVVPGVGGATGGGEARIGFASPSVGTGFEGEGGATAGGSAGRGLGMAGSGGAAAAGAALVVSVSPKLGVIAVASGGAVAGGSADFSANLGIVARLPLLSATLTQPATLQTINGRFPQTLAAAAEAQSDLISAELTTITSSIEVLVNDRTINALLPQVRSAITGGVQGLTASLPLVSSTVTAIQGAAAQVVAALPTMKSTVTGGESAITAALPTIAVSMVGGESRIVGTMPLPQAAIAGNGGTVGVISAESSAVVATIVGGHTIAASLTTPTSTIQATAGYAAQISTTSKPIQAVLNALTFNEIAALLPQVSSSITARSGVIATISAAQPASTVSLEAYAGTGGTISGALKALVSSLDAGFGAVGTVEARLPTVTAAIKVLDQLTSQQVVMVVCTRTSAVSTYESYPFNSFCELDGVYYGAGPNGLCRLDVGNDDAGVAIAAGFSTGLLDFKDPHQKRMTDAYMTLRTAGDLTLALAVDEADPVTVTLAAQAKTGFAQRRVAIPQGLRGKAWQFALNNTGGADFDFGQLGLNVAPSKRRI